MRKERGSTVGHFADAKIHRSFAERDSPSIANLLQFVSSHANAAGRIAAQDCAGIETECDLDRIQVPTPPQDTAERRIFLYFYPRR